MCACQKTEKKKRFFVFVLTTAAADTGVTCKNEPPPLKPLNIVPGGVTGLNATYYRVAEFGAGAKVHVTTSSGSIKVLAAIGYPPTDDRLQFGDNSAFAEKILVIDTDIPDVASVQDLQLYIAVQGVVADEPADFTIWFEPAPDEGPLPGIKPWSGILIIVLLVLLLVVGVAFGVFVYLKKSKRLENVSFRSGGKKAPKMDEYADGTSMIPLNDDSGGMRDALSRVQTKSSQSFYPTDGGVGVGGVGAGGSIASAGSLDHMPGGYGATNSAAYGQFKCAVCGSGYVSQEDLVLHVNKRGHAGGADHLGYQQGTANVDAGGMIDLYGGAAANDSAMIDLYGGGGGSINGGGGYFPQQQASTTQAMGMDDEEMKPLF